MVKVLEDSTSEGAAADVIARLVHTQSETVEDDDQHTESLKPCIQG